LDFTDSMTSGLPVGERTQNRRGHVMEQAPINVSTILSRLSEHSRRPRYAFMVLNLISEAAGPAGSVGPDIVKEGVLLTVRDWLSDALAPMAERDQRRSKLAARAAEALADELPRDPAVAAQILGDEIRLRVRRSGKTNVSRAVSDLVRAGLVRRHYAGWCKDHQNRGGQRQSVYTINASVLAALRRNSQLL
jgi:hypothetical protein